MDLQLGHFSATEKGRRERERVRAAASLGQRVRLIREKHSDVGSSLSPHPLTSC